MACPKCESKDVRRGEEGLVLHTYICNECGCVYEKLTPAAKKTAVGLGLLIIFGPAAIPYIIHN